MSLLGKTVVLTGAATESGAEIGRMLLHHGAAAVGLLDWHGLRLEALADALAEEFGDARIVSLPTNLTDRTQVRHSLREFSRIAGRIDLLVENTGALVNRGVGVLRDRGIAGRSTASWRQELQGSCTGIEQNLRTALSELGNSKPAFNLPLDVTVTGEMATDTQHLVSSQLRPQN